MACSSKRKTFAGISMEKITSKELVSVEIPRNMVTQFLHDLESTLKNLQAGITDNNSTLPHSKDWQHTHFFGPAAAYGSMALRRLEEYFPNWKE